MEIAESAHTLPSTVQLDGHAVHFRLMKDGDQDAVLAFTKELREEDLLFLRLDITQPEVVEQWLRHVADGRTRTVLALDDDDNVLGYGSIHLNEALWTRHLGEIRLLVVPRMRGHGLGRALAEHVFVLAQDLDLSKLVAQMMSTQHDAQDLFHHLGFIPEAMLHDWVIDRAGRTHDLILMAREVDEDA